MCCDWGGTVPPELDPGCALGAHGHPLPAVLPLSRITSKRQQIENCSLFALPIIKRGLQDCQQNRGGSNKASSTNTYTVVDFCCGSGWQTLPLAHYFPTVYFVLIDSKERSLNVAKERARRGGLTNVTTVLASIEDYHEPFDLGIALHACGPATDIAMKLCLLAKADCIMIPCCVGKVQQSAHYYTTNDSVGGGGGDDGDDGDAMKSTIKSTIRKSTTATEGSSMKGSSGEGGFVGDVSYPRSRQGQECLTRVQYDAIAKAADYFGHQDDTTTTAAVDKQEVQKNNPGDSRSNDGSVSSSAVSSLKKVKKDWVVERRLCKSIVENDRLLYMNENGYKCYLSTMKPISCSPKNDVIIGIYQHPQNAQEKGREKARKMSLCALPTDIVFRIVIFAAPLNITRVLCVSLQKYVDCETRGLEISPLCPSHEKLVQRLQHCTSLSSLTLYDLPFGGTVSSKTMAKTMTKTMTKTKTKTKTNIVTVTNIPFDYQLKTLEPGLLPHDVVLIQIRALLDKTNRAQGMIVAASHRSAQNRLFTGDVARFGRMISSGYPIMLNENMNVSSVKVIRPGPGDARSSVNDTCTYFVVYLGHVPQAVGGSMNENSEVGGEVEEEEVLQMFRWDLSRNVMSEKYCTDGVMAVPKSSWNSIADLFRLNTADERLVGAVAVSMRKKMEMWRKRKS